MSESHIKIIDKERCCACNACREVCPNSCIEMKPDGMGLLYPEVDTSSCIDCGLCVRTCPFINTLEPSPVNNCYAALNKDDNWRLASSSGGVFIELARLTISSGGVVFGAKFAKDWQVVHSCAETMDGVLPMMGSKYVQSDTRDTYQETKSFLDAGRDVLYTGTPCQIAGLKHYLRKDYPKLLTVELICHGAPAPGVWRAYLDEVWARNQNETEADITGINFRSKRKGWKDFGFEIQKNGSHTFEPAMENQYMKAFLQNWTLRPSCYSCKSKCGTSGADMTIGDFWGIDKGGDVEDDDKGVSCIICRSAKGQDTIDKLNLITFSPVDYSTILQGNSSLENSVTFSFSARRFQKNFPNLGFSKTMSIIESPSLLYRAAGFIKRRLSRAVKIFYRA